MTDEVGGSYVQVEADLHGAIAKVLKKNKIRMSRSEVGKIASWTARQAFKRGVTQELREARLELKGELYRLWEQAGEPSARQMHRDMPERSHMTWHTALRCEPVPPWSTFARLVTYMDGDPGKLEPLWRRARGKKEENESS